jgi:hypothetical protein
MKSLSILCLSFSLQFHGSSNVFTTTIIVLPEQGPILHAGYTYFPCQYHIKINKLKFTHVIKKTGNEELNLMQKPCHNTCTWPDGGGSIH